MANITVAEKKNAMNQLVIDTFRKQIEKLRKDADQHWKNIVLEILDEDNIVANNEVVNTLWARKDTAILEEEGLGGVNMEWLTDEDLRIQAIYTVAANQYDSDPLGVVSKAWHSYGDIGHLLFRKVWEEVYPPVQVVLPINMLKLTTKPIPEDEPGVCSMEDPEEYDDHMSTFDVTNHVPTDCRTQREFQKRADDIGSAAAQLYDGVNAAIRNARTDTAVIKAVPELEKYLTEIKSVDIDALLKKAAQK